MNCRVGCKIESIEVQSSMERVNGVIYPPEFTLLIEHIEAVFMNFQDMCAIRDALDDAINRFSDWSEQKGGSHE